MTDDTGRTRDRPDLRYPWNWEGLDAAALELKWRDLVQWVEWLQGTYQEWVKLPACWPSHVALRTELCLFRYWHLLAFEGSPHPAEGLRWQRELRQAAEAWRQFSDCKHEPPLRYEARVAEQRRATVEQYLQLVINGPLLTIPNQEDGRTPGR